MVKFCSLISGSSGNCTFISDGKTNILTDCGMSGKNLERLLSLIDIKPSDIHALLITHEHSDHVRGAGIISRRYNIPISATARTHAAMNIGEIADENRKIISPYEDFEIGTIGVRAFSIPHDAADPVGYSFFAENKKHTLATDMGNMNPELFKELCGSHSIILESNHDVEMLRCGPYPYPLKQRILSDVGHLSNEIAAQTALELVKNGTECIMLGHLSENNNRPEIAQLETYNTLTKAGVKVGFDVELKVADRHSVTDFRGRLPV